MMWNMPVASEATGRRRTLDEAASIGVEPKTRCRGTGSANHRPCRPNPRNLEQDQRDRAQAERSVMSRTANRGLDPAFLADLQGGWLAPLRERVVRDQSLCLMAQAPFTARHQARFREKSP